MKISKRLLLYLLLLLCVDLISTHGQWHSLLAEEETNTFSTWEGFEADKCASIWLIKRFINKDARIKFYPKGEVIKEGIPFDTPDAKFRRYHNMSTFESLLKHYRLDDPRLIYIGRILHDIEVNIWDRKLMRETPEVQEAMNRIITGTKTRDEVIDQSIKYFDSLYHHAISSSGGHR